jgi:hypothetical protein
MKRIFWGVLIVGFVLFSLSPTFYELSQKEKLQGRSFELVHNYITDYNFYLSRIREGVEGRWTVVERYTTEPHQGSFIQIFYLLLGKAEVFSTHPFLSATALYHISRVVFGAAVLLMTALWVRMLFPTFLWQVMAFLLVVTASVWPHVVPVGDSLRFGGPMAWWTLMDNLQRITFLPHLLFGQAMLSFLLFAGGRSETLKRSQNWIFLGLMAFVLGMVFPPGLVFVGVSYAVMILISFFQHISIMKKVRDRNAWLMNDVVSRVLIGLISFPSFLYFSLMFTLYPWKRLVELDIIHPLPFQFPEYIAALGPTLPLGILGLLLVVIVKDRKFMTVVSWVLAWFLCLFVFQYIPQQSPLRFSEMLPHVPLGILTTYLFYTISKVLQRAAVGNENLDASPVPSSKSSLPFSLRGSGAAQNFVPSLRRICIHLSQVTVISLPLFIIVVGIGVMISSFFWQKDFIDQKVAAGYPQIAMNNVIVYPIIDFTDALEFIQTKTPQDAIILSDMTAGNYIPPYTGRRVFVGHNNTVFLEDKLEAVHTFFRGEMTDAENWLTKEHISFIFFGPQEREVGKLNELKTAYPFLKEVYRNTEVILYRQ